MKLLQGRVNALLRAAVDDDRSAFSSECLGDGEANAGGRSGDQGFHTRDLQVHTLLVSAQRGVDSFGSIELGDIVICYTYRGTF